MHNFLREAAHRQTNRQTFRQTDRRNDWQTSLIAQRK